jgi:hypothetical protein
VGAEFSMSLDGFTEAWETWTDEAFWNDVWS